MHERNPNFHTSPEVEHTVGYLRDGGEAIPNSPADKITAYLGFLADRNYVNDGILTGDQASIDRQIDVHVIKSEDVPEGYFELQRRIAREQGHGDIEVTPDMRRQLVEAVQVDQRIGLGKWVEYLGGEDGGYPDWFKQYTWTSITKLGTYDKEKSEFLRRSRGTTSPYPELNREALAYVYDVLNKSRVQGEAVEANDELQRLLKSANFGKLYAYAILEVTPDSPELRNETKGSWTKFNQTDDPRTARRLAGSLQGHGTGWCTAGESTASTQLQHGDFYVYYTRDEDGRDTVPRVAIRMQDGQVAEVRGVNAAQELEHVMADIASERLMDLPGGEVYIQKADDMKRLTAIEKLIKADPEAVLNKTDLRFLYELDREIQGFGYERDPRIGQIRVLRGERDKPELRLIIPETIREQQKAAYDAYQTVTNKLLGAKRSIFGRSKEAIASSDSFARMFAAKDQEWAESGVYEYAIDRLIENGARFSLVATPNVPATATDIVKLAQDFGKDQPYPTYVYEDMYRDNNYSIEQWSGQNGSEAIRFSLIPSRNDPELGSARADIQLEKLKQIRAESPALNVRVPSVLDAVAYWYTLRAQGDKLDTSEAYYKTYIRHFDLPPVRTGFGPDVPDSCVVVDGGPDLDNSDAGDGREARVAVG